MKTPLPKKLANPAKRALLSANIACVEDLARFSEEEISALHGIGPTGLKTLFAAMAVAGITFRK